jgi:hypothetical protein
LRGLSIGVFHGNGIRMGEIHQILIIFSLKKGRDESRPYGIFSFMNFEIHP